MMQARDDFAGRGGPRARVLVDLAHAADGYVGIAQDTRLNFDMLSTLPGVDLAGLLLAAGRHDLPGVRRSDADNLAVQAGVLHWMTRNWDQTRLLRRTGRFREVAASLRTTHEMIPFGGNKNQIWRTLFEKTLAADRRRDVLDHAFYATDLSVLRVIDRVVRLRMFPPQRLLTPGFDYALFSMPRPVRLSPGTRQLIRFHDAVPLTDIDTQDNWFNAFVYQQLTRNCVRDAVFVCNSPQSLDDLIRLDPSREATASVVPCALAPAPPRAVAGLAFERVATVRRSVRVLEDSTRDLPDIAPGCRYLLNIGTLEPRKNQIALIRAWERVISRSDPELRLVIVGNTGWHDTAIVAAMQSHVLAGRIIHLERLPIDELQSVAAGAECFVFPSFNEGFGYPPLEAMQAGAACVISDIPVFRWIFGDSALFVDPYDVESIATAIERLVVGPGRLGLRAELASRVPAVLDRFSIGTVRRQWEALLDRLGPGRVPPPAPSADAPGARAARAMETLDAD